jgi:hypothetical protein
MINNDPLHYFNYDLTLFYQKSEVQKVHISSDDIPFTENISNTHGLNFKINYGVSIYRY